MELVTLTDNVVIDELLCFIVIKINVVAAEHLEKLCVGSFSEQIIEDSKLKFFKLCNRGEDLMIVQQQMLLTIRKGGDKIKILIT